MRGYVYSMIALIILLSLVLILYLRAEINRNSAEFYNELFRSEAMVFTIESIDQNLMDRLFDISLRYNLILLTKHTIQNPIRSGVDFNVVVRGLIINGTADGSLFNPNSNLVSPVSVVRFLENIKKEAEIRGIIIEYDNIDFSISQSDYNELKYSYNIRLNIYDIYNRTGKTLNITGRNISFKIDGMPDPLFLRYARIQNVDLRGHYPAIYVRDNPSVPYSNGLIGQGWVYGRVFRNINEIPDHNEPNILMGSWSYVSQFKDNNLIDGIIITDFVYRTAKNCIYSDPPGGRLPNGDDTELDVFNDIVHEEVPIYDYDQNGNPIIIGYRCERRPSRYPTSKNWIGIAGPTVPLDENDYNNQTILLITNNPEGTENKHGGLIRLYRVESLRDFVNCGYYFKLPNSAPSYIHRFYEDGHTRRDPLGIDILLIEDDFLRPGISSMLSERYNGIATNLMIRGLAGCKLKCNQANATKISQGLANILSINDLLTSQVR